MENRRWLTFVFADSLTLARLVAWWPGFGVAAAASDVVDGAISRQFCGTSALGQLLDPIADRVFLLMVVGTLWMEGSLALCKIGLLVPCEWGVLSIGMGLVIARNWASLRHKAPRWLGKMTAAVQLILLMSLVVLHKNLPGLFQITVALGGFAAADYLWRASQ
jgi:cardiolipin synthase (CMP-forming)